MGIKRYILFSIVFFAAIGGLFYYYIDKGTYAINITGVPPVELPLAAVILIVAVVHFLITLTHMFFYYIKNYFSLRARRIDKENMFKLISEIMLKTNKDFSFKTSEFKAVASVLKQMDITVKNLEFSTKEEGLKNTFDIIKRIKSGSYVPQNELKLPIQNNIMEQNIINKIKTDGDFAVEVLRKYQNYTQSIIKTAFDRVIEEKSLTTIKKFINNIELDREMILLLLKKDSQLRGSFSLSYDDISKYCKKADFTKNDFFILIDIYKNKITPDELIKLMEKVSSDYEMAFEAYLYTLLDYEMVDEAKELLSSTEKHQFVPFKALLDLKENGKHYSVEMFCPVKKQ
jgi:hypothetical protein